MSDFNTIETLARRLAAERGCDYDRKGAKRKHWRDKADRILRVMLTKPAPWDRPSPAANTIERIKNALANIMGGRW